MSSESFQQSDNKLIEDVYIPGILNFPSDHFPVVMRIGDEKGIGVMSFNVLNEAYKEWIRGDQGLKDSKLDKMTEEERIKKVLNIVENALENGVCIIGLQEVSNKLLFALCGMKYHVVSTPNENSHGKDFGCVIYNQNFIKLKNSCVIGYHAKGNVYNYIHSLEMNLVSDPNNSFTFINTHTKFGCITQLINHLRKIEGPIICVGDFNVGFEDPREESSPQPLLDEKEFILHRDHAPYSHVNTLKKLDLFDHFYTKDIKMVKDLNLLKIVRKDLSLTNTHSD